MRYYLTSDSLFIRGSFRACSGISGAIKPVSTIFAHSPPAGKAHKQAEKELEFTAYAEGIGGDYLAALTEIPVQDLCVLQYDFVTVFIIAGTGPSSHKKTATIIVTSAEGLDDAALRDAVRVAAEAKDAVFPHGRPADTVIAACEGPVRHSSGDAEPGKRIREAILYGVPKALERHNTAAKDTPPAFFIFSRFKGEHWVEWSPATCPYFPCHFPGQSCDFCYCPFYPCGDESLGQWVESTNGGRIWNCARCTLLHEPEVAAYLKRFPEASRKELVRMRKAKAATVP